MGGIYVDSKSWSRRASTADMHSSHETGRRDVVRPGGAERRIYWRTSGAEVIKVEKGAVPKPS